MAVVTITLTDQNLDLGGYSAEIDVQDSKLDDGYMTAAHLTGVFILKCINDPAFQQQCLAFAQELIESNPGCWLAAPGNSQGDAGEIAAA